MNPDLRRYLENELHERVRACGTNLALIDQLAGEVTALMMAAWRPCVCYSDRIRDRIVELK
jgi:hypothetical protein